MAAGAEDQAVAAGAEDQAGAAGAVVGVAVVVGVLAGELGAQAAEVAVVVAGSADCDQPPQLSPQCCQPVASAPELVSVTVTVSVSVSVT